MQKALFSLFILLCTLGWVSVVDAEHKPLPVDSAFQFSVKNQTTNSVTLQWHIAPGYFLYKDRIHIKSAPADQIRIGSYTLPKGIEKYDDILGQYEVYVDHVELTVPIDIQPYATVKDLILTVQYQGCASDGYCYPPAGKQLNWPETMNVVNVATVTAEAVDFATLSGNHAENVLEDHEFFIVILTFLGFGLLLAFTPCVLPMLPILSGLVLGRGKHFSHSKAFVLASFYVLGMAITYAIAGVLASYAGQQMQTLLQKPWLIVSFSTLFVVLALSLFGLYELRLPSRVQNYLNNLSRQQTAGSFFGVTAMGALSALLVSPCITPPLVGALTYMGNTGDVWLGGSALFAMGIGMGIPLVIFVSVGSRILPKSGPWMLHVEHFFGVLMLGVAIWLLERVFPAPIVMILWGCLGIFTAVLLGALRSVHQHWLAYSAKTFGILLFSYGVVLIAGGMVGQTDPFKPLARMQQIQIHPFERIKTVNDLQAAKVMARLQQKPIILDFYADWCVACKKMEKNTFTKPAVMQKLNDCFIAIQADITRVDEEDRALQAHLSVIAPPTLIFFSPDGNEIKTQRIIGEMNADKLLTHLQNIIGNAC